MAVELGESWGISGGSRWIETCAKGKLLAEQPIAALGPNPLLCPILADFAFLPPNQAAATVGFTPSLRGFLEERPVAFRLAGVGGAHGNGLRNRRPCR